MTDRVRPAGWEARVAAEIEGARGRAWEWGAHDCACFALRCARAAILRPTPWDHLLGQHATTREAAARIRDLGGLAAAADLGAADLGAGRIPPAFAMRGDLAAVPLGPGHAPAPGGNVDDACALGLVWGAGVALAAPVGVVLLPRACIGAAWPVEGDR